MVNYSDVLASNARILSALPKRLVAVFVGATSGIGEATLKSLLKYAVEPHIYLIARNQTSAERIIAECQQLNPRGEYVFVQADLSSIRETDRACEHIKSRDKLVNLVFLSAGQFDLDKTPTPEGLSVFFAAVFYSRLRITQQLLPLLSVAAASTSLARVVNVASGTYEGAVDVSNLALQNIPITQVFTKLKPQAASMITLSMETLAAQAPAVSFVHDFPGAVYTSLHKNAVGAMGMVVYIIVEMMYRLFGRWMFVPLEECAERQLHAATSAIYKPRDGNARGVTLDGSHVARGSDGIEGSGMYSIDWDGEKRTEQSVIALKELRTRGVGEIVWKHVSGEFERIAGTK